MALVMGDPCGISPELTAKLLAIPETRAQAAVLVIGDLRVFRDGEAVAKVAVPVDVVQRAADARPAPGKVSFLDLRNLDPAAVKRGEASATGGAYAMTNFKFALALAKEGAVDAICFTPFNKQALRLAGNPYEDEMQLAADELDFEGPHGEFNVLEKIWNARVTSHVPLAQVSSLLSVDSIVRALTLTHDSLKAAGISTAADRGCGAKPACRRRRQFRTRGDRCNRARGCEGKAAADSRGRAVPVGYGVPARAGRRLRCGADACITTKARSRSS